MTYHVSLRKIIVLAFLGCYLIASCGTPTNNPAPKTPTPQPTTPTHTQSPSQTVTITITSVPTSTATSTQTPTSSPSPSPSPSPQEPSPTPTEISTASTGEINVPILLYHQISGETSTNRYQVSSPDFQSQMEALQDMGFQTISLSQFLDALLNGTSLPENAIIITFDDGHMSVYENAFPTMDELGFSGILYIVANRINDIPDFMNVSILQEMIRAGWEVGSHSYTHADLTDNHSLAFQEIARSKTDLENALQVEIQSFAYPFGAFDTYTGQKVQQYGYQAGMGLGTFQNHTINTLFYLSRIEIYGDMSLEDFKQILDDD